MSFKSTPDLFETWLLARVAVAVEAGEVSGNLLMELREEIAESRAHRPEAGHAMVIRSIVDLLGVEPAIEPSQPGRSPKQDTTREQLLRDVAESWLAGQRKAFRRDWFAGRT